MKTVRMLKIKNPSKEFSSRLDNLMREFCSATRYAYNRLLEGVSPNDLNKSIPKTFKLNKRYAEDTVLLDKATISSQEELLPQGLEDVQAKIKKTNKKLNDYIKGKRKPKKGDLETCIKGLKSRIEKLERKEKELQNHLEEGTIPKVIFGGRKNFYKRMKGKITNKEWKDLRSNKLYSRGDKSKKGNLNTRLTYAKGRFFIEIADTINRTKSGRSPRIKAEVIVPDKFFHQVIDAIIPEKGYDINKQKEIDIYKPYTIQIKRKNSEYYINLMIEEETSGYELGYNEEIDADLIAGIDVNIDRIAVSIMSREGNFLKSKVFYCHEMEYVRTNKRDNIAGETAKEVIDWLLKENVGAVVFENLKFAQNHDTDRKFNRLTHCFAKTKLQSCLIRRALRNGFEVKKVNPAYTSIIGRFKYTKLYGLSVHEAASFVIGRRGLGYNEKVPKEFIDLLKNGVKKHLQKVLSSMEESKDSLESARYVKKMIKNIDNFKGNHSWTTWNVVNKTLLYKDFEYAIDF